MNTKKIVILIAIVALAASICASMPVSAQAVDEPWPMFHHDALHTGAGTGTAPTNIAVKWKTNLNGAIIGSPAAAYGKIYIGSFDKNLYCLDAQTGSIIWKYKTNWSIRSSAAVSNGRVYIGPDDGTVYCLNATNGQKLWSTTLSGQLIAQVASDPFQIRSSPAIVSGKLYVGHLDGKIYCLDATTGAKVWNYTTGTASTNIASSPAVSGGKVFCGSGDSYFYCLNANTGALIWRMTPGTGAISGQSQIVGSPTVVESLNEVVFFANSYSMYYALNMSSGETIWKYYCFKTRPYTWAQGTQCVTWSTPAYYAGRNVLFCIDDHFGQMLDAKTGAQLWPIYGDKVDQNVPAGSKLAIPNGQTVGSGIGPGYTKPLLTTGPNDLGFGSVASPAYCDGKVYFGTHRQAVLCLDANSDNGKRNSWYQTYGWVESCPIVAYGNVYVGDVGWNLYCFNEGTPRALNPIDVTRTVPAMTPTAITGTLSAPAVNLGDWIYISGKLGYASGAKVYERGFALATFTRPDGTKWTANMMADWDGTYKIPYKPDMTGTWKVQPWWYGDWGNNNASIGTTLTFTVSPAAQPTAASQPPTTTIITGIPDLYLYIGVIAAVALFQPVALSLRPKKEQ